MESKIKYLVFFLTILLLGTGLFLYLREKEKKSIEKSVESNISFEENLLATLPPDIKEEDMNKHIFSPDGKSVAYILRRDGKFAIVLNDSIGLMYDDLGPPHFSPDGKTIAYKVKVDEKWIMVVGDKKSEKFDDIDYPVFSSDGKRLAYGIKEDNKWFILVDNVKGEKYDKVEAFAFSPDSKRFAYRGNLEEEKKSLIVIDGNKGEKYDWVTDPRFSSDSKRVAYAAKEGDKWFMVIEGKKGRPYDAIGIPVFSPDGKKIAYGVREGDKSFVVIDDKKSKKYDGVWNPYFSPNSQSISYFAKEGSKWFLVVDGKENEKYEEDTDPSLIILSRIRPGMPNIPIGVPVFSSDSKRLGYWVKEGSKRFMVIDKKKSEKYDDVSIPYFSTDGERVAYGVKEGINWFIVADEEKYNALYGILPKEVPIDEYSIKVVRENSIVFSPVLEKIAFISLTGSGYSVAVNDKLIEKFDLIGGAVVQNGLGIVFRVQPTEGNLMLTGVEHLGTSILTFGNEYHGTPYLNLSPDGKKIAFGARKGRELWWKVIKID